MVSITDTIITAIATGIGVAIGNFIFQTYLHEKLTQMHKTSKVIHKKLERPRRIFLATLLNFFLWGSGYWYIGKKRALGTLLFLVELFIFFTSTFGTIRFESFLEYINYGFFSLVISMILAYDAYRLCKNSVD